MPSIRLRQIAFAAIMVVAVFRALPGQQPRERPSAARTAAGRFTLPIVYYTLPNGLKVTLVPSGSLPKVTVALEVPASVAEEVADTVVQ